MSVYLLTDYQPYWFKTSANPPVRHADVYLEWGNFLGEMATHVRMEAAKGFRSEDYAINFVRKKVGGVGIYMSEELFFLSGDVILWVHAKSVC